MQQSSLGTTVLNSAGRIFLGRSHVARVAEARVDQINKYCQGLIKMPSHICDSKHVISFFTALPGDVLLPPYVDEMQHVTLCLTKG